MGLSVCQLEFFGGFSNVLQQFIPGPIGRLPGNDVHIVLTTPKIPPEHVDEWVSRLPFSRLLLSIFFVHFDHKNSFKMVKCVCITIV